MKNFNNVTNIIFCPIYFLNVNTKLAFIKYVLVSLSVRAILMLTLHNNDRHVVEPSTYLSFTTPWRQIILIIHLLYLSKWYANSKEHTTKSNVAIHSRLQKVQL